MAMNRQKKCVINTKSGDFVNHVGGNVIKRGSVAALSHADAVCSKAGECLNLRPNTEGLLAAADISTTAGNGSVYCSMWFH